MSKIKVRLIGGVLIILVVLNLSGCSYKFAAAPNRGLPLDNMLIGVWQEGNDRIEISRKNRTEYNIKITVDDNTLSFSGYPIKVGNRMLVQTVEKIKTDNPYHIFSYTIKGNQLTLIVVKAIGKNPQELKKSIIDDRPDLYMALGSFTKVTDKKSAVISDKNPN